MKNLITSTGKKIEIKYKPLYLGVQLIDKKQAKENLFDIIEVLQEHNIRYGLFAGTLLGAVRENDFIAHDEDVDLYVLEEDRIKLFDSLPTLLNKGFSVVRYHRTGKTLSIIRNNQYTDFSFFGYYNGYLRNSGEWLALSNLLETTKEYVFLGKSVRIPTDAEGLLECTYGLDWHIPIKWNNYEMPAWKRLYHNIRERIKEMIPSSLYFYLINRKTEKLKGKYIKRITDYCINHHRPIPSFEPNANGKDY